jgi:superoxide dismutase, Cu-Zn family
MEVERLFVIHEKADDYKTDPAGNCGARIACGVFKASAP